MPNTTPPMGSLQLKEIFEAKINKLKNKAKLKSIFVYIKEHQCLP